MALSEGDRNSPQPLPEAAAARNNNDVGVGGLSLPPGNGDDPRQAIVIEPTADTRCGLAVLLPIAEQDTERGAPDPEG